MPREAPPTMRRTSAIALKMIQESGLITGKQQEVYEELYEHGPATATELARKCGINGLWKRLPELRDFGLAFEQCVRPCDITGNNVIEWEVTNMLPDWDKIKSLKQKKKKPVQASRKDLLKRISELEAEIKRLKKTELPLFAHAANKDSE